MLGIWKKQEIMLTSFTNLLLSKYKELFAIYIERNNTNKKHCPLNKKKNPYWLKIDNYLKNLVNWCLERKHLS